MNRKHWFHTLLICTLIISITLVSSIPKVHSESPPHRFKGYAMYNNAIPAPDGTLIRALVINVNGSVETYSTLVNNSLLDKNYDFNVLDPQDDNAGRPIFFFIDATNTTQTISFVVGGLNQGFSDYYNLSVNDTIAPTSSVDHITGYWKTTSPVLVTAVANDTTSGVKNVTVYYRFSANNATWDAWMNAGTDTSSPWSWSLGLVNNTGYYEFYSIATDNATNVESAPGFADTRCGYDHTAPTCLIQYNRSATTFKNGTVLKIFVNFTEATSGMDPSSVTINISTTGNGDLFNTSLTQVNNLHWYKSWTIPSGSDDDGVFTVKIYARDNASNPLAPYPTTNTLKSIDNTPPILSVISVGSITTTSAKITWTTNENANSAVDYGTTTSYGSSVSNTTAYVTTHSLSLSSLSSGTVYHYRVISYDPAGNAAISSDATFTTLSEYGGGGGGGGEGGVNIAPTADADGPYTAFVNQAVILDASKSKDTDGTIVGYRWDWTNDGTWDTDWVSSPTISHIYTQAGSFTVKLQVRDNASATAVDTANVTVEQYLIIYASPAALAFVEHQFGVNFTTPFYAADTNGDGIVDSFTDPNGLVTFVRFADIKGNVSFLLSTGNDTIPEFFWDTNRNMTILVSYTPVIPTESWIDPEANQILLLVNVEKSGWIYLVLPDYYSPEAYPNCTIMITTTSNRVISSDLLWRENATLYVLDEPAVQYLFIYTFTVLPDSLDPPDGTIFAPAFNPTDGTVFDTPRPVITITYFEETMMLQATLNNKNIRNQVTSTNQKTYRFTPSSDLTDGTYILNLRVQDVDGNTLTSAASYTVRLTNKPVEIPWLYIILIAIILIIVIVLIILRRMLLI